MNSDIVFIIADNQAITRQGLHGYITESFSGCTLVDVADKQELLSALKVYNAGTVVLDYTLFNFSSAEELLIVVKRFEDVYWILFSNELSDDFIRRMTVEQRVGMILKENSGEEIRTALLCASRKERYLCHQITNLLIVGDHKRTPHSLLTATEVEVLKLIAHGKSVKEIANERNSSTHTIITHKKNIFRKLEVNNVHEATKYALRAGLVDLVEYYI